MLAFEEVEDVVREVYPPIGTEFSWEPWEPGGELGGSVVEATRVGHVADVVDMLMADYHNVVYGNSSVFWCTLRAGYAEWVAEGKPDPMGDLDNRYTIDLSHIITPVEGGGWRLVFRFGVGWYDCWYTITTLDVSADTTQSALRQMICEALGKDLQFMWPRTID